MSLMLEHYCTLNLEHGLCIARRIIKLKNEANRYGNDIIHIAYMKAGAENTHLGKQGNRRELKGHDGGGLV